MVSWLVVVGLLSLVGQVILLRELNVAFFGVELAYIVSFGAWMVGTAAGALAPRRARAEGLLAPVWPAAVAGMLVPLAVVFIRASRSLMGGVPGAFLSLVQQAMTLLVALVPVSTLMGWLFQRSASLYIARGHSLAAAYGIESLGALAAGALATLSLFFGLQNFSLALVAAWIAWAAAAGAVARTRSLVGGAVAALVLIGMAVCCWRLAGPVDQAMTRWAHPALVVTRDTPYSRVTVSQQGGQASVFEDDALAFDTEGTRAEELVHLAAIQRETVRSVLVIGGGLEGIVREVLQHRPARVDYVEMNRRMYETVLPLVSPAARAAMTDPVVHLWFEDPVRWLGRRRGGDRYDLVLVAMPDPASAMTNRCYTREFFSRCLAHLEPDGVLAFRLSSFENVWTPLLTARNGSIYRALTSALGGAGSRVIMLPGTSLVVLASPAGLSEDQRALSARLARAPVQPRLVSPAYVSYLYLNDRRFEIRRLLDRSQVAVNTESAPVVYQYAALLWLSKFVPGLRTFDAPGWLAAVSRSRALWFGGFAAVAGLVAILRRRPRSRAVLLAGSAGLIGMVIETILVLAYQSARGMLFQDVGILLTSFMGGLSVGALLVDRHRRRRVRGGGAPVSRALGVGIIVAIAVLCLLVAAYIRLTGVRSLAEAALLLVATGMLTAAAFAYASLREVSDQHEVIGPLYGADLIGGAIGTIVGGLILVPLAGLVMTAVVMAALAGLACLLV